MHANVGISLRAMRTVNDIMNEFFNRILSHAIELMEDVKHCTLLARDLEYSCKLAFPPHVAQYVTTAGNVAVQTYLQQRKSMHTLLQPIESPAESEKPEKENDPNTVTNPNRLLQPNESPTESEKREPLQNLEETDPNAANIIPNPVTHHTSRSTQSNLIFPVGRIDTNLRIKRPSTRIGATAPVFIAAALEFLCAEILTLSGGHSIQSRRTRITPRHVMLAIRTDEDLKKLFSADIVAAGGVVPFIHRALLPRRRRVTRNSPVADL